MGTDNRKLLKVAMNGIGLFLYLLSFINILASFLVDKLEGVIDYSLTSIALTIAATACCYISLKL